jgi:riboflavin synthase alpha subunit
MFTGLIEAVGEIVEVKPTTAGFRLRLSTTLASELVAGDSLAVNGVCLTVVGRRPGGLAFDLGPETLACTALGELGPGSCVNLERPLRLGAPLGGHLVLGHVDGVGTVEDVTRVESTARVRIALPGPDLAPYLVPKGSVAVEGVSLTVADLQPGRFEVMLIPHTLEVTTLGRLRVGQAVNIETDVIGKYVVRSLTLKGT